jgi:type I restriction enzyme S subunit
MSEPPMQKYEAYKDSGSFWLGEIPESWSSRQLKYVAALSTAKIVPTKSVRYVGMENVHSNDGSFVETERQEAEGLSISFMKGDVLFGKLRPYLAKSWMASFSGICSSEFLVLRARDVSPKFLNYITLSREFISIVDSSTYGTKMPRASWDFIGMLKVPVPDRNTSTQIAKFLDYETAKIDRLIEKQQQLIALLKEKRQAVISHAVTKGLNPAVAMRHSGIEWLGEVPAHWDIKRLGHLGKLQNGLNIGGDAFGSGYPFVSYGDVYNNVIVPKIPTGLVQSSTEDQRRYGLQRGDVLFTRTSETVDDIGVASTCLQEIPNVTFAGFLIRFRPSLWVLNPIYSSFLFRNQIIQDSFAGSMNLVTRASLSQNVLKTLPIGVPPIDEQDQIAKHLSKITPIFDELEASFIRQRELLQERRTALISAAVTGKIDVRGWQPPQPNPDTLSQTETL